MNRIKAFVVVLTLPLAYAACSNSTGGRYAITDAKDYEASLFRQNCAICHGPEAEGKTLDDGRVIPNLRTPPHKYNADGQIFDHIANGGNGMVPFRGQLSDREIRSMVEFVQTKLRKNSSRALNP